MALGLDRVNPTTGTVSAAAHFASTDDVVVRNGIAYVADNGGGTMSAVTLASEQDQTRLSGIVSRRHLSLPPRSVLWGLQLPSPISLPSRVDTISHICLT